MTQLCITVRWLDDRYHGKVNREGPAEWPPSPYRLFQALLAGIARGGALDSDEGRSLRWLQSLAPPVIIAPRTKTLSEFTRYVPNNDGDKKFNRQQRLTDKLVCPTLMLDDPEIHYLWTIDAKDVGLAKSACQTSNHLTCLGWGIDIAFANGRVLEEDDVSFRNGIRWHPRDRVTRDNGMLRIPVSFDSTHSTWSDLQRVFKSNRDRVEHGHPLNPALKPTVFDSVFYESSERPLGRPYSVFELREDKGDFSRTSQRRLMHVAGMTRHAAIEAMRGSPPLDIADPEDWVDNYVAGHAKKGNGPHKQFSYVPLPSIGMKHTDPSIRRVMVIAPLGDDRWLQHLTQRLSGQQLKPKRGNEFKGVSPTLIHVKRDNVARFYTRPSNIWASVTPVILPGHDDHKSSKTIKPIEKALRQSGVEQPCTFEWGATSWWPQSLSAHKYDHNKRPVGYFRPKHLLSQTAVHLKLKFDDELQIPGPLTIGAGRHCGFGLMAGLKADDGLGIPERNAVSSLTIR